MENDGTPESKSLTLLQSSAIGGGFGAFGGMFFLEGTPFGLMFRKLSATKIVSSMTLIGALAGGLLKLIAQKNNLETQSSQLLSDNIAMRAQLNQTGQILRHVASEVEKGSLPDSQLTLDESKAPPTHVARLEAQQATAAAQTALTKI